MELVLHFTFQYLPVSPYILFVPRTIPLLDRGFFKTVYPQLSEDSLRLFGRSEPTEFGRWGQWTSVLMAGVLGGGF